MTTTEAIRHLGSLYAFANAQEVKAVEMAIEALKRSQPTRKHKPIIRNAIKCVSCDDVIESIHRHDAKKCKCGRVGVDGGLDYLGRIGNERDFIDMGEWA